MPTVYRKTAKGHAEIATRMHRLAPRLRQALILVDGQRSDDDLRRMIAQQPDEALQALAADGFVEVVASAAAPMRPAVPAATPAAPAAPAAAAFSEQVKRDAVRVLIDQLGPMAESLAIRIERARSADELRALLEQGHRHIRDLRGAFVATAFADRFLADETA